MVQKRTPEKIVLFDIDGTLINSNGSGGRAMLSALEAIFGCPFDRKHIPFAGRTDRAIIQDLMVANHIVTHDLDISLQKIFDVFPEHLIHAAKSGKPFVLPGIQALLTALQGQPSIGIGLVTGNIQNGARTKLTLAGIQPEQFLFGAYGNDFSNRNYLPPLAIKRAADYYGSPIQSKAALIVGDTPADIECAHCNGIPVLAVATGEYSMSTLAQYKPDFLVPDLSNLSLILSLINDQ